VANPNGLYLINVGGNDIFDILTAETRRRSPTRVRCDLDLGDDAEEHGRHEHRVRGDRRRGLTPASNGAEVPGRNSRLR
jgi:hypothetical protein